MSDSPPEQDARLHDALRARLSALGRHRRREPAAPAAPVRLEQAVSAIEVVHDRLGAALLIPTPAADLGEGARISRRFELHMARADSGLRRRVADVCTAESLEPADVVFLDLETTGLGCAPLFLVGTMVWESGGLLVRQYLARDYREEPAAIALALEELGSRRLLVTFNGKTFDYPFLRTRARAHRIRFGLDLDHFDLLHAARTVWRRLLPDCRLQTLESYICRRPRGEDIPGAEIPDAYHAFVRSGDASRLVEILRHNALDLLTLADLMTYLPAP